MTATEIAAQLLGAAGIMIFIILYQFNTMKNILKAKMVMDVFWAAHYLLIGASSAFAINMICLLREFVFLNRDKKLFASRIWLCIFIAFNLASAAITWKSYYSIFPAVASSLATISFGQKSVKTARVIGISNNVLMAIYDLVVGSYMGLAGEALAFISVLIAICKSRQKQTAG